MNLLPTQRIHPLAVIFGLLALVVVVQTAFLYVAQTHKDGVVQSYITEDR